MKQALPPAASIDANAAITIPLTLPAATWSALVTVLQDAPYRVAAPTLGQIRNHFANPAGNGVDQDNSAEDVIRQ